MLSVQVFDLIGSQVDKFELKATNTSVSTGIELYSAIRDQVSRNVSGVYVAVASSPTTQCIEKMKFYVR